MTPFKAIVGCAVLTLSIGVLGSANALAATKEPGLLQAADLPDPVDLLDDGSAPETVVNQFVLDADACTQTIEPDDDATGLRRAQFAHPETTETVLSEVVILYPNAKAAKAAFKRHAKTARDGIKCGSVETSVQGSGGAVVYSAVKFPKIAGGSYSVARGEGDVATDAVAVEFVSGPYVVVLNNFGNPSSVTINEMKALARKAEKRLRSEA